MRKIRYLTITFDEANIRFLEVTVKKNQIIDVHNSFIIENKVILENNVLDREKWADIIKTQKNDKKIKAKTALINIPISSVILRQQTMPDVSLAELKQMLSYEISNTIHLPFNNPVFDIIKGEAKESLCNVTFIATSGDLVTSLIEGLQKEKIKVENINIPSLSLYYLLRERYPEQKDESKFIIQIRRDGIDIAILDGKTIWFNRHVNISFNKNEIENYIRTVTSEIERATNFFRYTLDNKSANITGCWISSEFSLAKEYYNYIEKSLSMKIYLLSDKELAGFEVGLGSIFKEVNDHEY